MGEGNKMILGENILYPCNISPIKKEEQRKRNRKNPLLFFTSFVGKYIIKYRTSGDAQCYSTTQSINLYA